MDSFWSSNGAPSAWHFAAIIYFAVFFFVARFFLDRFIFRSIARWLLTLGNPRLLVTDIIHVKIKKCSESLWKFTYYFTVELCILSITFHDSWFRNSKEYFKGWPHQELRPSLKLFYMCQCGFYVYSVAALLTWETRRKDFSVMMSHHVVTIVLIGVSYMTSFFRIGCVVLALHDASDVFMEAAKVFKYSEKELGASICFGLFAASWLILRLIVFPFWVIISSSYDLCDFLDLSKAYPTFLYYAFNTLLLTLLIFHIYWWILICSMITRQLENRGRVGEDIRSDSDDDG